MGRVEILDFLEKNPSGKFDYLEIHKGVNDAGYSVGVSSVQHVLMGLRRRNEVNTEVVKRERVNKRGMVRVMLHFHKEPVGDVHIHCSPRLRKPISFDIAFSDEKYTLTQKELGITITSASLDKALKDIQDQFKLLWKTCVECDEEDLTEEGLEVRKVLKGYLKGRTICHS